MFRKSCLLLSYEATCKVHKCICTVQPLYILQNVPEVLSVVFKQVICKVHKCILTLFRLSECPRSLVHHYLTRLQFTLFTFYKMSQRSCPLISNETKGKFHNSQVQYKFFIFLFFILFYIVHKSFPPLSNEATSKVHKCIDTVYNLQNIQNVPEVGPICIYIVSNLFSNALKKSS